MGTYQGWEVEIKLNKPVTAESIGTGDGSSADFTVANTPIGDVNGDTVVDKDDVTVYVEGSEVTVDSLVAATGVITLASAPATNAAVTADYSYENTVGYATSCSFEVTRSTEFVQVVGQVAPLIKEGPRQITGSIENMLVTDLWYLTAAPETDYMDDYVLVCKVGATLPRTATLMGLKFDPYSVDIPQDDRVVQSLDFKATSIKWVTAT